MRIDQWQEVKLGDVANVLSGYAFKSKDFSNDGVPVIKIKNIVPPCVSLDDIQYVSKQLAYTKERYQLKYNDVLISLTGSNVNQFASAVGKVGRVKIKNKKMMLNQRVGKFEIIDENKYSLDFLYYYISTDEMRYKLASNAGGAANQANISPSLIKELLLPLPSLPEQKVISATLSVLDDTVELNNKINKSLEEMAQAIFKSWFVDFEPFKDSEFEESELGLIPKGWSVDSIGNYTSLVTRGISPKYTDTSDQYVINQKCIRKGSVTTGLSRTHCSVVKEEKILQFGDVLINSTGVGTLGRVAQVYEDLGNYTVDSHVTIVRPDAVIRISYMGCLLKSMENKFENAGTGSTGQTELGREAIKQMKIIMPSNKILEEFSMIYDSIYKKITIGQNENVILSKIRNTLLPKLISGEIRIPLEEQ